MAKRTTTVLGIVNQGSVLLLFALLGHGTPCEAQVWCTPGSAWYHDYFVPPYVYGYLHEEYAGDTIIEGSPAQRITRTGEFYNSEFDLYSTLGPSTIYTQVIDDVVYLYRDGFDTLYNFNAVPGDHWGVPFGSGWPECDTATGFTVTDTGHVWIDDIALRFLAVSISYDVNYAEVDTVIERIGALRMAMTAFTPCIFDQGGGGVRCFSDAQFAYQVDSTYGCATLTSIPPSETSVPAVVKVDPSSMRIIVELPEGNKNAQLVLFDAMGRKCLGSRANGTRTIMPMNAGPGVYLLRVLVDGSPPRTVRFLWP